MTNDELRKLRDGDIIRNIGTGNAYNVLRNSGHCVIAVRTMEVTSPSEWEHVYTPSPTSISLVQMVTELQALGWTFNEGTNRWTSPNGRFETPNLRQAWDDRNMFTKVFSFAEARAALRAAGWKNPYGKVWQSPSDEFFDGARAAYEALTKPDDGTCNAT